MGNFKGKLQRPSGQRNYRKVFYIFTEGRETEPIYFNILKEFGQQISLKCKSHPSKTNAKQILQRAKDYIKAEKLAEAKHTEIWLVVDVDNQEKEDFKDLFAWEKASKNCGLAISNPKFEYWLLLHFDKGNGIHTVTECEESLKKHMPNYEKSHLDKEKLNKIEIFRSAIHNASERDKQLEHNNWKLYFHTSVFQLVEKILPNV